MRLLALVAFVICVATFTAIAQTSPPGPAAPECLPPTAPLNQHVQRLKADINYGSCLSAVSKAITASCGPAPAAGGDPMQAAKWRMCTQSAILLQDLEIAAKYLLADTEECAKVQLPAPCQAREESEKRLEAIVGSLLGQQPSLPMLPPPPALPK